GCSWCLPPAALRPPPFVVVTFRRYRGTTSTVEVSLPCPTLVPSTTRGVTPRRSTLSRASASAWSPVTGSRELGSGQPDHQTGTRHPEPPLMGQRCGGALDESRLDNFPSGSRLISILRPSGHSISPEYPMV